MKINLLNDSLNAYGKFRMFSKAVFAAMALVCISVVLLFSLQPWGRTVTRTLRSHGSAGIVFTPEDRVSTDESDGSFVYTVQDDLVYFATQMDEAYETAEVRITFRNPWPDQNIYIGFKDQSHWHFQSKLIDSPFLNTLNMYRVGSDPTLYQKKFSFSSVDAFLASPTQVSTVGLYNFDIDRLTDPAYKIDGYTPSDTETVLDIPLRGRHTLFAYLENEPFRMKVGKQDLNWYEGADPLTIDIFKDGELVFRSHLEDDGITDPARKSLAPQTAEIRNPGPGMPEPGIYKIIIDATNDSVISTIRTNLNKVILDGPVYPVRYAQLIQGQTATTSSVLFSDSIFYTAMTLHHDATQSVRFNGKEVMQLHASHEQVSTGSSERIVKIEIPKSDIILNAIPGYFATQERHLFRPIPYNVINVTNKQDSQLVDFILADYTPSFPSGQWTEAVIPFNLSGAAPSANKLGWMIRAPDLREKQRTIQIKELEVTLRKKPMIKL